MLFGMRLPCQKQYERAMIGSLVLNTPPHIVVQNGPRPTTLHPEQPAPAPHLAHTGGCVALRIVLQEYLAHKKHPPPQDHHRSLGIGLLFDPAVGGSSYERGTLVVTVPRVSRTPPTTITSSLQRTRMSIGVTCP